MSSRQIKRFVVENEGVVIAFILFLKEVNSMTLRGKMEHSHLMAKLIVWLGCIFVMFSLVTLYIAICAFDGIKFDVTALKWIQLSQTIALFLVPSLLVAYLVSKSPIKWLKLDTRPELKSALWAIGIMLVALPAINLLAHLNQQMVLPTWLSGVEEWMKSKEAEAEWLTKQFMSATTIGGLLVNLFLMAVLPALSEEITFRGVLQRLLSPKNSSLNSHLSIWLTAIIFSAIHMQFYGFIPRMLLGALFGYMFVWTGSLWVPMLMHFVNNGMAVLLYYIANRAAWDMDKVDAVGTGNTLWLGVVSLVLTIVGIYMFRRSTTMRSASSRISSGS
ncbi:MAG: CPBP family intramembrane metalloprotease [Paludibacteraceae bacterium]|nr:CPBP family intramembrane metalloprotease [Paludibacteraceae bacterium]